MAGQIVPAGVPLFFDYTTFDKQSGLFAGITTQNLTDAGPESAPIAMPESSSGSGIYKYPVTLTANKQYLVTRRIYTDSGLTSVDTNRGPETDMVYASTLLADVASILSTITTGATGQPVQAAAVSVDVFAAEILEN